MSERLPRTARVDDMRLLLNVADENLYSVEERIFVSKYRQKYQEYRKLQEEEQALRPNRFQKKLGFFGSLKQKKLLEKIRICKNELTLMETEPPLMRVLARERIRDIQQMNEEHKRFYEAIEQRKIQEQKRRYQEEGSKNKTATSFYNDCVADFHQEAAKYGVAQKGVIFIPELIPFGEKTILAFLQDRFFQMQFGNNAQMYYYAIMSLTIDAGIAYAARWHEQFSTLNSYVAEMIEVGPADDANLLLSKHFPKEIAENQGNMFFQKIYPRWIAMHDPYWKLADPRDYTFKAMLAAYQLGVSMMLEKLGY